jgi:hypothetical protein
VVRGSVEETLNALLDAEADRLCNAQRYERSEATTRYPAGHYERKLQTKAGEVRLRIPKLRTQTFETAIIERYRRRESVEEALIEMYLAGVSVRRVEDITEALWGTSVAVDGVGPDQGDLRNDRDMAQPADQRTWPARCPADHLGRLHGAVRKRRGVLPRCGLATLHRALVPQHLQPCALDQGARSRRCSRRSTSAKTS